VQSASDAERVGWVARVELRAIKSEEISDGFSVVRMPTNVEHLLEYYTKAGPDYEMWSKKFNMHFGYYQRGMDPLDLEGMLDKMNREVIRHLALDTCSSQSILDMGCGLGATARYAASAMNNVRVYGVTIVPWQVQRAIELTNTAIASRRAMFVLADYTATPFRANTFDGVYALESSCYAPGYSKEPLLQEAYRILKPGKRLVVADAFLKTARRMGPLTRACYKAICSNWSLETLGNINHVAACLRRLGFMDVRVANISRNVAPSILHIPLAASRFLKKSLFANPSDASSKQWGNVLACILLLAFVVDRRRSGYFIVSCTKPPSCS